MFQLFDQMEFTLSKPKTQSIGKQQNIQYA